MEKSPYSLGERIKHRRLQLGMSQEDLAERLYTTRQLICQYEKDRVDISVSALREIAAILEVSPAWFFDDAWNKPTKKEVERSLRGKHVMSMYDKLPYPFQELIENQVVAVEVLWNWFLDAAKKQDDVK